jgi:hypothetical protein
MILLRILGYLWASPNTIISLLIALTLYFPKSIRFRHGYIHITPLFGLKPKGLDTDGDGTLDFFTGGQSFGGAMQFFRLKTPSARLQSHEEHHSVQGMILGPFFGPAYLIASLIAALSGKHFYRHNWFEKNARENEKG